MFKFDRRIFFDQFREWRGSVTQQQVNGLNFLLNCIESDPYITRLDWAGYMLGTTMHETAFTFMPIHEYGSHAYFVRRYGGQTRKGRELGNDTPEEGYDYAGKGDVQLTGETNYEKAEIALRREYPALVADFEKRMGKKFDLTVGDQPNDKDDPKNAQDPMIAYAIMSYGMRTGMFTGKSLRHYTNGVNFDWVEARRIINGTDKAAEIGNYGIRFTKILKASLIKSDVSPVKEPVVLVEETPHLIVKDSKFDVPPDQSQETRSEVTPSANTATSEGDDKSQTADQITNINQTQKTVPDSFVAEDKVIAAPPPSNMLTRGWKWVAGLGLIPTTGSGLIEATKNLFADGQLNARDVFGIMNETFRFLLPYLIWVGIAFIVFWGLKELLKQISFIVNQYTLARGDTHNVTVVPTTEPTAAPIIPVTPEMENKGENK